VALFRTRIAKPKVLRLMLIGVRIDVDRPHMSEGEPYSKESDMVELLLHGTPHAPWPGHLSDAASGTFPTISWTDVSTIDWALAYRPMKHDTPRMVTVLGS